MIYRGIIVDNSLEDTSLVGTVKTLTMKCVTTSNGSSWFLRLVAVSEKKLDQFLALASDLIRPGWYMHFYNHHHLIVVFKDQVFRFPISDKRSWQQAINYGKHLGIKAEQLDFWPHRLKDEQAWLTTV